MEVHGQLRPPMLDPCGGFDDQRGRMPPQQSQDMDGYDCCNFWTESPNTWCNDVVRTDVVNPEKFQYNKYRYQLYAKPKGFDCNVGGQGGRGGGRGGGGGAGIRNLADMDPYEALHQPGRTYVPPFTDIRALQQTMYVPVVPTKPGGEKDVTFPMTARTMGQPDVTTACCIPVVPCNPGFKNMTNHIKPTPADICQYGNRCGQGGLQRSSCERDGALDCCQGNGQGPPGAPPQFISAPSNVQGGGFTGVPDTFPSIQQRQSFPNGPQPFPMPGGDMRGIPGWGSQEGDPARCNINRGAMCMDEMDDGTGGGVAGAMCMNNKVFSYKQRTARAIKQAQEAPETRERRLRTMFGAYGAAMQAKPLMRPVRAVPCNITEQGNGFHWDYPKNENRQCYVLQKNSRC